MARFVYDATLVGMTLEKLNEAYNELENTEMEIDRGISMICSANGSEIMDIDYSPILNYFVQVTEGIDSLSTNIKNTAHQIEDYQNAPWHKKLFSTLGMTGLKLVEGIGGVIENLGDGLVSIAGFAGGLFNSEFKESCAEFVKKDILGDAFANAYETGALQNVNKYSIYSHESTAANIFKGFGTAAAYVALSLATGHVGSKYKALAVLKTQTGEIAVEAGVAALTGIGQGTQEGLQEGKSFNSAFGTGLITGVKAAAGEAMMGIAMNKVMAIPEVQNAIGSVVQKFGKAKAKFTSKALKNADEVATGLTVHSDEVVEVIAKKSEDVLSSGKKANEVIEVMEKSDELVTTGNKVDEVAQAAKTKPNQVETPKLKEAEITPVKQVSQTDELVTAGNKVDEVAQTAKASDGQYKLTRDEIIQDDLAKAKPKQVETPKVNDVEVSPTKQPPKVDEVISSGKTTDEVIQTNKVSDGQYRLTRDEIIQDDLAKVKPKQVETPKVKEAEITPANQTPKVNEVVQATKTSTKVDEVVSSVAVHSDESSAIVNLTSGKTNIPSSAPTSSATKVAGNLGELVDDIPVITSSSSIVGSTGTMMKVGMKSTDDIIGAGLKSTDDIIAQTDEAVDGAKNTTKGQQSKSTPKKKSKVDVTKSSDELDEVVGATSVSSPPSADLSKVKRSMDEMGGRLVKKQENLTSAQEALKAAKASGADDATITALQKNVDKAQKEYTRQYDSLMKKQKQYIEMTESGQFNKIGTEGKHKLIIGDEVVAGPNSVAGNITTMRAGTELADGTVEYRPNWTDATAKAEGQINKREFAKLLDEKYGPVGKTSTASATNDALSVVAKTDEVSEVVSETAEAVVTKTDEVSEVVSETAEAVVTKTDEVSEVASETIEQIATKTDEVSEVASETAEQIATKTDEVAETASETAEAVATKTDEVAETASETAEAVVTKTDEVSEVAAARQELSSKLEDINSKKQAASETLESLKKREDEIQQQLLSKKAQKESMLEECNKSLKKITRAREDIFNLVDEIAPNGISAHSADVIDVNSDLASALMDYHEQASQLYLTGVGKLDLTEVNKQLKRWRAMHEIDAKFAAKISGGARSYQRALDEIATEYDQIVSRINKSAKTITENAPITSQTAKITREAMDLSSEQFKLEREIRKVTSQLDELGTSADEVMSQLDKLNINATNIAEAVVTKADGIAEVASETAEQIATKTDEVSEVASETAESVVTKTDEVSETASETAEAVVTKTDEVAETASETAEAVVTKTDEVAETASETAEAVVTKTDEVAAARQELSSKLDDITSQKKITSEKLEGLQKRKGDIEYKINLKETQQQAVKEQFARGFEKYEYSRNKVRNLINELSPNGIKPVSKATIAPHNSLAQALSDYYEQGTKIMQRGKGILDTSDIRKNLEYWYTMNAKEREMAYKVAMMMGDGGSYNYSAAMSRLEDDLQHIIKTINEYTESVSETVPAVKQIAQLSDELNNLRVEQFRINTQVRGATRQLENLTQKADEIVSQLDSLSVNKANVVEELVTKTDEVSEVASETAEAVVTKTDEVSIAASETAEQIATKTDEVAETASETAEAVVTKTDEVSEVASETAEAGVTKTDEVSEVASETIEQIATKTDEVAEAASETAEAVVTKTDEVAETASGTAEAVVTKTDEVAEAASETAEQVVTKTDEPLETSTGADTSSFDSGLEDVTRTKSPDLKVADDVEVVDISTSTGSSTPSHFDEILESAEESASKVFGHSNFDEIIEPVKYGDEVSESLFGENPGKRFEDLSRRKDSDISRLDKLQRDNYYYQEGLHSMRNDFNQLFDGQLFYEDLDSWIYKMRGKAEDFFGQYRTACSNAINSGGNNFSSRLIGSATSADDVLDLRKVQLFDDYELDQQYRMAKQRLEYKAEEMIAESLRYGRGDYSDVMRHISRQQETLETNYRRLKKFSREFSDMQDEMVRTYRNTIEEVRAIDTDLSKAYKAAQYEQLSAIKSTPARTYTTFEEYAKTLNLDGIVNPNGSGIIKLGDIEIKATPDMLKRISSELGSEGMARVRTGVITVNDVQDIQTGIIESIRKSAGELDVTLPSRPNYIQTLDESFTRPAYGIDELNEVNQYLSDVSKQFNGEAISKASEMSGPKVVSDSLAGDTGIPSKYAKLFSDSSSPNSAAIRDILKRAEEPIKIMKFSDAQDLIFGTSKSTDDLSALFKDGPSTPKGKSESLDLEDLFGSSKTPEQLPNVFDDVTTATSETAEAVVTKTDEVSEVASETAEAVVTKTDEVSETASETAEAVVTKTDEVAETASKTAEAVATKTDEVSEVASETAEAVVTKTDEVAEAASETAEAIVTKTDEVVEAASETAEVVVTKTDEVAVAVRETAEELVTKTDEAAVAVRETAEEVVTKTDEVAVASRETAEQVVTKTDEVAVAARETAEEVVTKTDEVAVAARETAEQVVTKTDEVVAATSETAEEVVRHTDEFVTPSRSEELFASQSKSVGNAEYIEESSIFSRKNNARNVFKGNDINAQINIPSQTPVITELQQQWVDYLNYEISMGRTPVALFNSTSEISSAMLSKIDDLSQVKIQLLDGLGDGNGMLKAKYNSPLYIDRVTYSGHEMKAIVKRLEQLQSKIDMSLPPSQRAKQIYDMLSTEIPVMHDFGNIPDGHKISASLRGLTPVNSAGKEGLVCAGYSSVYKELCERADIPCDYIRGKGNADPLRGGRAGGHAWNVVHTEIGDIPVDVTWSACSNGTKKWFGASEDFASTHWSNTDEFYQDFSSASMTPRHTIGTSSEKMNDVINILEQKYGSRSEALFRLESYINSGDPHMITRTGGARDIILSTEPSYVQNYVYYARQNSGIQQIIDTMNYRNGDSTSGYYALRKYLETGNPQLITRTNGARDLLSSLDPNIIEQYLTGLGW